MLSFPAMHGRIGKRDYFVAMVKLALVPKLFKFLDWAGLPPEQRAQRTLQKSRIPEITQYILDNEDGYIFSSLTASYNCEPAFMPVDGHTDLGILKMPFEADLVINDGQHRRAAIEEALNHNPALGQENISVVFFPWEDIDRVQQMFSDLNRTARKTSKSLDILFNHRDLMSQVALAVIERLEIFRHLVDKERISLPLRSPKLFTLGAIHDGTKALLEAVTESDYDSKLGLAMEFWECVENNMPEWGRVKDGDLKPSELRQEYINTHAVVLWAVGAMGRTLVSTEPVNWKEKIKALKTIDWRRINREWQGVAMSGSDVVNQRQARMDTASFLKRKLGLPLTPAEEKSLLGAMNPALAPVETQPPSDGRQRQQSIKPTEVRIGEFTKPIRAAVEIPVVIGNWIIEQGGTLRTITNFVHQTDSGFLQSAQPKRLENGWYIDVHGDQKEMIRRGRRLLDACGFREVTFQVVLENGDVL